MNLGFHHGAINFMVLKSNKCSFMTEISLFDTDVIILTLELYLNIIIMVISMILILFLLHLTFSHQVERHKGTIEHEPGSRLWFALCLFSCAGLPNPEQLLTLRCHVRVLSTQDLYNLRSFSVVCSSTDHLLCRVRPKAPPAFTV